MEDLPHALVEFVDAVFGRRWAWVVAIAISALFLSPIILLVIVVHR